MKKGIILIGKTNTGKSRIANLLMDGKKSVTINGREKDLFKYASCWGACDKETEVIHIDDLKDLSDLDLLCNAITDPIRVDKQSLQPFYIHPKIIISINGSLSDLKLGMSLKRRFDIFELSGCNQNY